MEDKNIVKENIEVEFSNDKNGIANSANKSSQRYYYKNTFAKGNETEKLLTFIMLNPSNADQFKPDKTVTNIKKITIENDYNAFAIVNLFSYRTGSPKKLIDKFSKEDYSNDKNWETLSNKLNVNGNVVLAWGSNAKSICNKYKKDYYNEVLQELINKKCSLYVYDLNKDNSPRHPGPLSFNRVKNIKLKKITISNNNFKLDLKRL